MAVEKRVEEEMLKIKIVYRGMLSVVCLGKEESAWSELWNALGRSPFGLSGSVALSYEDAEKDQVCVWTKEEFAAVVLLCLRVSEFAPVKELSLLAEARRLGLQKREEGKQILFSY